MIRPGRLHLFLLPFALAVALACSDDSASPPSGGTEVPGTPSVHLGESFALKVGETIQHENSEWSLNLAGIPSDSRCPIDVTCVWAGEVTASLLTSQQDQNDVALNLTLGPIGSPSAAFNEFRVTLEAVSPAPRADQTISLDEYVVTLVVRHETDPPATSGIRGAVTLGPQCPVVREGTPCPDQPYEGDPLDSRCGREPSNHD